MSGGYFEYKQRGLNDIASTLDYYMESDQGFALSGFSDETRLRFMDAITKIKEALIYIDCIDMLLCDDYSENTFNEAVEDELYELHYRDKRSEEDE